MDLKKFTLAEAIALICIGGWMAGCEKSAPTVPAAASSAAADTLSQPAPAPATQPTTEPATQPALTSLHINQVFKQFPGARLRLVTSDDHVTAILYTSDPPAAINDDYTGNSFYLKMPLEQVIDASAINGAEWRYKSISSDRSDSNDGIFLNGLRHQLQPIDLLVRFDGSGPSLHVRLAGTFMDFDNAAVNQPGMLTSVSGDVLAEVDTQQK
jgi:hypothetical protein